MYVKPLRPSLLAVMYAPSNHAHVTWKDSVHDGCTHMIVRPRRMRQIVHDEPCFRDRTPSSMSGTRSGPVSVAGWPGSGSSNSIRGVTGTPTAVPLPAPAPAPAPPPSPPTDSATPSSSGTNSSNRSAGGRSYPPFVCASGLLTPAASVSSAESSSPASRLPSFLCSSPGFTLRSRRFSFASVDGAYGSARAVASGDRSMPTIRVTLLIHTPGVHKAHTTCAQRPSFVGFRAPSANGQRAQVTWRLSPPFLMYRQRSQYQSPSGIVCTP
mmetsp:Transcript_14312/g.49734  ORF Transcript_14312/g.49734 Transcript_14312/m.49734 type:complete len:269 (-) Transcript_14312:2551-3357(-)